MPRGNVEVYKIRGARIQPGWNLSEEAAAFERVPEAGQGAVEVDFDGALRKPQALSDFGEGQPGFVTEDEDVALAVGKQFQSLPQGLGQLAAVGRRGRRRAV